MPRSRFRLGDAAVVAVCLAVLLVAGRLHGGSLRSGGPVPDRAPSSWTAAQAPPGARPRGLPVVARILLPGRSGLLQGGLDDERAVAATPGAVWVADGCAVARVHPRTNQLTGWVAIRERHRHGDTCRVLGLTISPDGRAWLATPTALVGTDRAGRRITGRLPLAPSGPPAAAAGAIWVPCCQASERARLPLGGWLLGVDPATTQVDGPLVPAGGPAALLAADPSPPSVLAGHDAVFMSDPPTGVVWQVDPHRRRFTAAWRSAGRPPGRGRRGCLGGRRQPPGPPHGAERRWRRATPPRPPWALDHGPCRQRRHPVGGNLGRALPNRPAQARVTAGAGHRNGDGQSP